ncbi:MAG: hypothetical protein DRI52_05070 [Chloroflexi bacterium]|nr:MAG: hypothetical protein DRI52_05070 [Chloroflexota bacterium]
MMGRKLIVYTDGAIRERATGLGVVIRDGQGQVLAWRSKRLPRAMTCNEAEYEALILGLEVVHTFRPREVCFRLDSLVVVNQMRGVFAVRDAALRQLNARARKLVAHLPKVVFSHVGRRHNRLADALAQEAVESEERSVTGRFFE